MSILRWPYQIEDVRVSGIPIRQRGMVGWWPMDSVPEIPDDQAGVTYLQDEWATVDGWVGFVTTPTVASGVLELKAGGSYRGIGSVIDGKTVRLRIYNSIQTNIQIGTNLDYFIYNKTMPAGWNIIDFTLPSAGGATFIVINSSPDIAMLLDWIYVGTGAYLPNSLLDNSGNGNGSTVKGSTPIAGTSGSALLRDGINDYEVSDLIQTMPDVFWYHEIWTVPNHTTQLQALFGAGIAGAGRLLVYRDINNTALAIVYWNGSANTSVSVANFFPATTIPVTADVVVNWLTGAITIYKNGVYFATLTMTAAVKPSAVLWYFGNQSALSATQFAGGIVDERRIYNREPSAEEVLDIYNNPELYRAVPQYPQQDGFGESPQDGTIRSSMDSGPAKTRQRFTALTTQFQLTYQVNDLQKQVLDGFYRYLTRGGSLAFEWPHPVGYDVQARFTRPPSYTPNGPEYISNVQLEVLP